MSHVYLADFAYSMRIRSGFVIGLHGLLLWLCFRVLITIMQ